MHSLRYLTLILTLRCSAHCAHCCVGASTAAAPWMSAHQVRAWLPAVCARGDIRWASLIGGEVLLDVQRTLEIGRLVRSHDVPRVEIDTNASWAVDSATATDVVGRIYDAGLAIGALSLDGFHQAHVDVECVLRVLRAARQLGVEIEATSAVLQEGEPVNSWDRHTARLRERVESEGFSVNRFPVVLQGRAARLARHHTGPRSIPTERCEGVYFFATRDWREPGGVQIDPQGHVMLEHGLCIGSAQDEDLGGILDAWDAASHPIVGVLLREGPLGLTHLPEAEGFTLRPEGYVDKCHLCQEIRTFLRPRFPEILGPAGFYP